MSLARKEHNIQFLYTALMKSTSWKEKLMMLMMKYLKNVAIIGVNSLFEWYSFRFKFVNMFLSKLISNSRI